MNRYKSMLTLALACVAITFSLTVHAQAQTLSHVANFTGTNGSLPYGPMVQGTDGNFYGAAKGPTYPYGEIFRVTPGGKLTSLYSFCSLPNCADGKSSTPPILGSDGNLYGVATNSGDSAYSYSGTLYKLTLAGKMTTIYTFCPSASCVSSDIPNGIIQASDGNFYGTASEGGAHDAGLIFKVTPAGTFTQLYSFCAQENCADGAGPLSPPIEASDGSFYGTAENGILGDGVLYKVTPSGSYKVIHNSCYPCIYGGYPSNPVQDAEGNFFGTTAYASSSDTGTVFEITATHQYIVLHTFPYHGGVAPTTGLTRASDGNFYGVGSNIDFDRGGSYGTIFEITPSGEFTTLDSFETHPNGPLVQGTDGSFYGTTLLGGTGPYEGDGTIFKLSNGLSPLVYTVPMRGKAGKSVLILGNGLTGTTSVTFNGVQADFSVQSDSYIKATVPSGATSGAVSVVTPSGTLNSNPQFFVTK